MKASRLRRSALTLLLATSLLFASYCVGAPTSYRVPMSDGVRLGTDVYLPSEDEGPWPVLLERTPYNRKNGLVQQLGFTDRGYAVVIQNVRGTRDSEGLWALFGAEGWGGPGARDGVDTVAWIRAQPWCDGGVGAIGFSASGIAAQLLMAAAPEGLKCAFVNAASDNLYETMFPNGLYRTNTADTWPQAEPVRPLMRQHPTYDVFWRVRNARERMRKADVPLFVTGGWFDLFERSTTVAFSGQNSSGLPRASGHCKMVILPLAHAAPPGELEFPDRSETSPDALIGSMNEWLDFWLKDAKNGILEKPPVALFVMTDKDAEVDGNRWQTFNAWPPPSQPLLLYLHGGGALSRELPPPGTAASSYVYDPRSPAPSVGGNNLYPPSGPHDQRPIEARDDVLVFETGPLDVPQEVIGPVTVTLYVSSDARDTDFIARLCDVYPDRRSMLFCEGAVRARYRDSNQEAHWMTPGEVYELQIDLWDTALVFAPGHCIRLDVTSSSVPRYDANPNTGEPIFGETHTVPARNTIHHSRQHPSHLTLPLVAAGAD